jgi:iron complex transport system substrate-binding protein
METRSIEGALGRYCGRGPSAALAIILAAAMAVGVALLPLPWATVHAQDAVFPVTVIDDEGTEVTIEAPPKRIVSLSPANTEVVFALGAGDRLAGGTAFDDYPAEAAGLPDVATFQGVIMERIVALDPDLVLAAGNFFTPPDDIARMRELGYPVVVVYAPDVSSVLADIELIGAAIGASAEAEGLTALMSQRLDEVAAAAAAAGSTPRTFYQIGSEPEIYAPAPESFVADMVVLAGGDPITTSDPALFSIPLEELIAADPEVIIVGDANYGVCPADVAARAGWGDMSAVVNGDIRPVDDVPVTRPGPRLAQGLASLARAIHPDLELSGFPSDPPLCTGG